MFKVEFHTRYAPAVVHAEPHDSLREAVAVANALFLAGQFPRIVAEDFAAQAVDGDTFNRVTWQLAFLPGLGGAPGIAAALADREGIRFDTGRNVYVANDLAFRRFVNAYIAFQNELTRRALFLYLDDAEAMTLDTLTAVPV